MPPKRRDATQVTPPPTSTTVKRSAKSASATKVPRRFRPLRFGFLVVRIGVCLFALRILYKRYSTQVEPTALDLVEQPNRTTFEEVALDRERRDAVLDAFKVPSIRPFPLATL
ncbi:hypothetical protein JCM10212_005134 [Sporobolomyces blumeae]